MISCGDESETLECPFKLLYWKVEEKKRNHTAPPPWPSPSPAPSAIQVQSIQQKFGIIRCLYVDARPSIAKGYLTVSRFSLFDSLGPQGGEGPLPLPQRLRSKLSVNDQIGYFRDRSNLKARRRRSPPREIRKAPVAFGFLQVWAAVVFEERKSKKDSASTCSQLLLLHTFLLITSCRVLSVAGSRERRAL